jgi:signal transduction histidine kinase
MLHERVSGHTLSRLSERKTGVQTRSLRRALLAPLVGILLLVPAILLAQYFIQVRSLRAEYKRYSHEVAVRMADLIGFSYLHIADLYTDLLPSVTACHEQLFADLPADPTEIDLSNTVARALSLLSSGLHCDVAVVSRAYRVLDTTYRQELGVDLSGFPDAVAAFAEAAQTRKIVHEFPVVDSTGHHIRLYTHSIAPGGAYFVQLGVCHERAEALFNELKLRIGSAADLRQADVYLFNMGERSEVAHVFNLRGNDPPGDSPGDAVQMVDQLARDPAKTSVVALTRSGMGHDYYQQVAIDPALAGPLPFGAVVRVRLDSTAHRRAMANHVWSIAVAAILVLACICMAAWSLNKTFHTPIRTLAQHVRSAEPIPPDSPVHATQEFTSIARQFNEHLERISRSETKLNTLYEQTEQLVRDRTADLEAANRLLNESESELRFLSKRLLASQEEQMRRIALELHDEFGQCLTGIRLMLDSLGTDLKGRDGGARTAAVIDDCRAVLNRVMRQVQNLVSILRPEVLDSEGVEKAIQWLGDQYHDASLAIRTQVDLAPDTVPEELRMPIFRIAQEAINNAVKHSGASVVTVVLTGSDRTGIELVVDDNGCGFECSPDNRGEDPHSFGLVSMRERAQFSGGALHIDTAPGQGTRIRADWSSTTAHQ